MSIVKNIAPAPFTLEEGGETYTLRGLTGIESLEMVDYVGYEEGRNTIFPAKALAIAIKYGLTGWENLPDRDGGFAKFSLNYKENLNILPADKIKLIGMEIIDRTDYGVDAKKKSSSQQPLTSTEANLTANTVDGGDSAQKTTERQATSG